MMPALFALPFLFGLSDVRFVPISDVSDEAHELPPLIDV